MFGKNNFAKNFWFFKEKFKNFFCYFFSKEDASLLYLFEEGYCGYYQRVETCSLDNGSEQPIVISMECDESLIFGLSRLGVSVFFTTLAIFIILTLHWKFENTIGNSFINKIFITLLIKIINTTKRRESSPSFSLSSTSFAPLLQCGKRRFTSDGLLESLPSFSTLWMFFQSASCITSVLLAIFKIINENSITFFSFLKKKMQICQIFNNAHFKIVISGSSSPPFFPPVNLLVIYRAALALTTIIFLWNENQNEVILATARPKCLLSYE